MVTKKPLGVRLNNPLNIRWGQPYEGLAEPSQVSGFGNFSSPVWGFRAAFRNYITKYDRGVNTIRALVSEWAPPSENDTEAYVKAVSAHVGIGPDEKIPLKTWAMAKSVCYAMTIQEQGDFDSYFTVAQMAEGAFRAGIVDAPAPITHRIGVTAAAAASAVAGAAGGINEVVQNAQPSIATEHHGLTAVFAVTSIVLGTVAAVWNATRRVKDNA